MPRSRGSPFLFRSQRHLFVGVALGVLLPIVALAAALSAHQRGVLKKHAELQAGATTDLAAQVVQEHLEGIAHAVERAAANPSLARGVAAGFPGESIAELRSLVAGNAKLDRAFVTDAAGVLLADWPHVPEVIGKSFAYRDWYHGVSSTQQLYVSSIYRREAEPRHYTVAFSAPLRHEGSVTGYLVAQHTIESIAARLAAIHPSGTDRLLLLDRNGIIASRLEGEDDPRDLGEHPLVQEAGRSKRGSLEAADPLGGAPALLGFARIEPGGFIVISREPMAELLAPVRRLRAAVFALCALCFGLATAIAFYASDRLREEHARVVELEEARTALTAMIVHDLRNPLTVVLSSLEMLREDLEKGSVSHEDATDALHASQRLLAMINTLLDVTRMEDGKMPFAPQRQDVGNLLAEKVKEFAAPARARGVDLRHELEKDSVHADIDVALVARVVENLITNALKHTRSGGEIVVRVEKSTSHIRVVVCDDGEGIPREFLPKLFQKYSRSGGQALGEKYDTGLGLLFSRMATELHGGGIAVESELGKGSTFVIELPRQQVHVTAAVD